MSIPTPAVGIMRDTIPVISLLYQDSLRDIIAGGVGRNGYQVDLLTPTGREPADAGHIVIDRGRHYLVYRPPKPLKEPGAPGKDAVYYVGFQQDKLCPDLDDLTEVESPNELHNTAIFLFKDRSRETPFEWKDGDPVIPNAWASAVQLKSYWVDDSKHNHVKSRCIKMEILATGNRSGLVEGMYRCITDILNDAAGRKDK